MIRRVRRLLSPYAVLGLSAALTACGSGGATTPVAPPPPTPSVSAVSVSAPSTTIQVGATLQLSAVVSPSTVSQAVTWSSSAPALATVSASGLVTALVPGTVTITATSTVDATRSGSVSLTLSGCFALTQAQVTSGATLAPSTCHQALVPLTVNTGTLVVQPGVRIEFGTNGSLTIATGGRMNAIGTAALPIVLTSTTPAGTWRGLRFDDSRGVENALDFITISNAGSSGWSGAVYSKAALFLEGNSLVSVRHATIANSGGTGITALADAEMTFEDNTLRDNAIAAWVHPNAAQYIGGSTVFTANTENVVRTVFGNTDAISRAQTWHRLAVPYEIQTRFFVDAAWTLEPGVVLSSLASAGIITRAGGSISAIGTSALPIKFTSRERLSNSWKGIQITTAAAANRFDHVLFENGGNDAWTGNGDSRAMVYLSPGAKAVFTNSTFAGSGWYALWVSGNSDIAGFSSNTFNENERAMIVHPDQAGAIAANNRFLQNKENRVRVTFGNTDRVRSAQTWHDFGTPFLVMDRTFVEAPLAIAAGVELEFAQNASLLVAVSGTLRANGTSTAPVVFRGAEDLVGYWIGIEYATASASNVLTHVSIRNAGSAAWTGGANATSSIHVTRDGVLSLTDVSFDKSGGYAAIVRTGGTLSCTNVSHNGFLFYLYTNAGGGSSTTCS